MKKFIALLLVLCMVAGLVACKKPAETPDGTTGSPGRRNQTADQHQRQNQGNDAFHGSFSFQNGFVSIIDGYIESIIAAKIKHHIVQIETAVE